MLDFSFQDSLKNKKFGEVFFRGTIKKAVFFLNLTGKEIGLSLNLVGRRKIKKLNLEHREKNKPTDVLSFPTGARIESRGIIELGDIFICLPIALADARAEKISPKRKLELLTVHGFLHLLGYDHETKNDSKEMFSLQDDILGMKPATKN